MGRVGVVIVMPEGYEIGVIGWLDTESLPYNVWVADGLIIDAALNFSITNVTV